MSTCGTPGPNVLSDFEQGNGSLIKQGGRTGWWYVFADTNGGSQSPPAMANGPIAVAAAPSDDKNLAPETCNKYALHSTASGHTGSMAYSGFGATFIPGTGMNKTPYAMLSQFDGIQFDIKSGGSNQGSVFFEILTTDNQPSPAGIATNQAVDLFNTRGYVLTATGSTPTGTSTAIPTAMTTVYVPFSLLVPRYFPQPGPNGCGTTKCQSPVFTPANALGFQFSEYNDFSTSGSYDLWVDNVSLYTGDNGLNPSNPTGAAPTFNDGSKGWSCTRPTFLGNKTAAGKYLLWAYRNWQSNYVRQAGSTTTPCTSSSSSCIVMSPEVQGGSVVSEGIAYGMLIAAYMGDQPLFDKFWSFWNAHGGNLMTWIYSQDGNSSKGSGSATDADEDAAYALYVASKLWPGTASYATNRDAVINAIWSSDFDHTTNLPSFGSNSGNNSDPTNPSYFAPAYYPIFNATNSNFGNVTSAVYAALNRVSSSGLPPAWCTGGNCAAAGSGGRYQNDTAYQYDAHRVPWRVGIDFCWNGSTSASGYLSHLSSFFSGQAANGIDSLYDEYTTGGTPGVCTGCTPAAQPNSMSLVGTAAVGALAGSNGAFVNAAWQFVLDGINRGTPNTMLTGNNYYTYFNTTVGLLTALTLSGNFYKL
jgi:hypothetical protein